MIGFFEHQYLSYKKDHIKTLLALAKSDGFLHEEERRVLFEIGARYKLKHRQILAIIDSDEKFKVNIPNNFSDKMDLLYDLMLMVNADGVVEDAEVEFCEEIVGTFGLKKEIVRWLLQKMFHKAMLPETEEWTEIKEVAKKEYVLKK